MFCLHVCVCNACLCVCAMRVCVFVCVPCECSVLTKVRREHWILWKWSYGCKPPCGREKSNPQPNISDAGHWYLLSVHPHQAHVATSAKACIPKCTTTSLLLHAASNPSPSDASRVFSLVGILTWATDCDLALIF